MFFPQGTYAVSKTLEIKTKSVRLVGVGPGSGNTEGSTMAPVSELRFTGVGDGVFFNGGTVNGPTGGPNALLGCGIADLSICGTSHLTNCLRIRNTHHSHFARIRVADCTAAGLKTEFAVANVYDHFRYSTNETPPLKNALPTYGIHLSRVDYAPGFEGPPLGTTASHFIVPIVEGAINGYFEEYGSTNIVTGGTFEGCWQKGMIIGRGASHNVYSAIDLECNQVGDIEVQGGTALESGSFGHLFDGILAISGVSPGSVGAEAGGINFLSNSYQCTVVGGQYYKIQIQGWNDSTDPPTPPAQLITLVNARYMHSFTDNGQYNRNLGTAGPSGAWDTTKIPGGIVVDGGSTLNSGVTIPTTHSEFLTIHVPGRDQGGAITPGFRIVYRSDTTRGLYCDIDEKDVNFGGAGASPLGTLYFQGMKPGVTTIPVRINPFAGTVGLGNGSGAIKSHYQKTEVGVTGPAIDPNSRKPVVVPLTGSGFKKGDLLIATPRGDLGNVVSYYAYVSGNDEVTIVFFNFATGPTTANSVTWDFMSWRL